MTSKSTTMVLGRFSAPCRALVATNQAQPTVWWEAGGVFWGRLVPKCCPKGPFWALEHYKIDATIDTKIDAEKVSTHYSKLIRKWSQNGREFAEQIHLFAKG